MCINLVWLDSPWLDLSSFGQPQFYFPGIHPWICINLTRLVWTLAHLDNYIFTRINRWMYMNGIRLDSTWLDLIRLKFIWTSTYLLSSNPLINLHQLDSTWFDLSSFVQGHIYFPWIHSWMCLIRTWLDSNSTRLDSTLVHSNKYMFAWIDWWMCMNLSRLDST